MFIHISIPNTKFVSYIQIYGAIDDSPTSKEHFHVVQYLIEQGEADPNIANSNGYNALHYAVGYNSRTTELIQLLLNHISINNKDKWGFTPLDCAYWNKNPLRQEIIALLRSKGGKANYYDENGRNVGRGNGDLNH